MTAALDIHPADELERAEICRNVYEVWGDPKLSLDAYVEQRLRSVQHNRASWYVGCRDGQPVTSLGVYPLTFQFEGDVVPGFAIGAVHTVREFRGHGFAGQLFKWIENDQRNRGKLLGLLYSDIDPKFYERLGYQLCPAHEGWWEGDVLSGSRDRSVLQRLEQIELIPFSPHQQQNAEQMDQMSQQFHRQLSISIRRDEEYSRHLLQKSSSDDFFWVQNSVGLRVGYLRVSKNDKQAKLIDWTLTERTSESLRYLTAALIRCAQVLETPRIGGWLPDHPTLRDVTPLERRSQEITMLKWLGSEGRLSDKHLKDAAYFREIDHV